MSQTVVTVSSGLITWLLCLLCLVLAFLAAVFLQLPWGIVPPLILAGFFYVLHERV